MGLPVLVFGRFAGSPFGEYGIVRLMEKAAFMAPRASTSVKAKTAVISGLQLLASQMARSSSLTWSSTFWMMRE
ncbi:hypothetical protein C807_02621 [Lachnospiraceae bacterium 28-4]|nr:hypothetical protein C807_02621 [Lachnospiraceae bacterium 28-4]